MHSTTISSSATTTTSTPTNTQPYHYPSISTLRRASRPSNISIPVLDHNNAQQSNDPGIYSAPIYYLKQTSNAPPQMQHSPQPYTSTLQYRLGPHFQMSSHNLSRQQNMQVYPQQPQMVDPFGEHQHTPHTFPLPASPNHYHQYFHFPPSTIQMNATNNSHQSTTTSQPSTPTHNNHLRPTQIQEQPQQQPQWSNPVLSSLMNKRMNENPGSISMDDDDDEDPSASIDALVADVDSHEQDLLDDEQRKTMNQSNTSSTIQSNRILSPPHSYLRSKSHILTTPPNPLASDDHPDNQIKVTNTYQKTYSPIPSAGFELTNKTLASSNAISRFTFDTNLGEQTELNKHDNDDHNNNNNVISKPLSINNDMRTTRISSNSLIQDDNSNHSSTNSSSQTTSSRIYGQIIKNSEQKSVSSSPLSNDIKLSSLGHDKTSTNPNRHACTHPDCNKTFTNKSALAKHKLTHSQDRKHVCPKCSKGFKRLDHLNGHMLTHEEEKPHKCRMPNCNRTYCDARSLKRHIENAHQDFLAAIIEGGQDELKKFLPETAFVKTKDSSVHNEFSMDSVDSNSPRSLIDNEQSFHIRSSTGTKTMTTYTFDEEKCIECHVCKRSFKNGAALNGHMRLHGGFNDKPPQSSSNVPKEKTKRSSTTTTKRKRTESPSVSIKTEIQDRSMISATNSLYPSPSTFSNQLSNLNTISKQSSPGRSSLSSSPLSMLTIPTTRTTIQIPIQPPYPPQIHMRTVQMPFDPIGTQQILNVASPLQHYDDRFRDSLQNDHHNPSIQSNGILSQNSYGGSSPYRPSPAISPFQIMVRPQAPPQPVASLSISPALLQQLLLANGERIPNTDFSPQSQRFSPVDEHHRCTPSPHIPHRPVPNPTPLNIHTPVPSSHSNQNTSHRSPLSSASKCNKEHNIKTINKNSTQSSSTIPTQIPMETPMKQETSNNNHKQEKSIANNGPPRPAVLEIVPDTDSPTTKTQMSGFLIGTPSSTSASSSTSTSSNMHFHYDDVPAQVKKLEPTPSSFQWPLQSSQLRRQCSLNLAKQSNPVPSTPYTPPPMLSPFRRGPGLYYRVFSHPGTCGESVSIPTTPILPGTPIGEELTGPKINIGSDYQAAIPKLRTKFDDDDDVGLDEELLFSPLELSCTDEKSLEKFEALNQINPYLFSPRDSPKAYPLELIYMLLHEYNGDLSRTIASLIEGRAKDIKQCRPLHTYHFLDCDKWTKEEIEAFSKALPTSEKNFETISRAVGTKTVKQCIEFYYMPKTNLSSRKIVSTRTSSVITRRKRFQMNKAKQQLQNQFLDDDMSSSSSFNEFRIDDDGSNINSDTSPMTYYSCDIDECSQTFTTDRAYRAHRKEHRRTTNNTMTTLTVTKRTRNVD